MVSTVPSGVRDRLQVLQRQAQKGKPAAGDPIGTRATATLTSTTINPCHGVVSVTGHTFTEMLPTSLKRRRKRKRQGDKA
jgi:hypothetical protein